MSEEILKGGERKEEESAQLLFIMANEKATKISDGKKVAQKEESREDGRGRTAEAVQQSLTKNFLAQRYLR